MTKESEIAEFGVQGDVDVAFEINDSLLSSGVAGGTLSLFNVVEVDNITTPCMEFSVTNYLELWFAMTLYCFFTLYSKFLPIKDFNVTTNLTFIRKKWDLC